MFCGLLVAALAWLATRTPMTIEGELAKVPAGDRQALDAVLAGTGLGATQLTPIGAGVARGFGVLKYHEHAIAVENGRIVELRLSNVPLPHPEALAQFTGLQALWLSGDHLTSVPDLSALKGLVFLNLSDNAIADLSPLTALTALKTVDVTKNPGGPNPTAAPSAPARPANWIQKLPPNSGHSKDSSRKGMVGQGSYSVSGTITGLNGVSGDSGIQGSGSNGGAGGSTLEISVEKGRVRGYLEYVPTGDSFFKVADGYVFAEAEPGKPGKVSGILPSFTPGYYTLVMESVGGEAEGVRYRVYR
jgi:hypothetical protein